jgi:gamma-glutamyltranspeptidase / glutathione hydrolase
MRLPRFLPVAAVVSSLVVLLPGLPDIGEAPYHRKASAVVGDDWETRLARTIPLPEDVVVARSARGVAATLNEAATRAAVEVMESGGNAMDAAAAAWLVLSVVSPNQTGLGGGGYILYHDASVGQTHFVDANVRAGMAAHPGVFLDEQGEPLSNAEIRGRGMAVGVPGLVRGFDVALKRWGTRYFDELVGPAVRLAEDGWEVDRELSLRIHQTHDSLSYEARAVYAPDGEPLQPGELLVQRDKARTLRLIGEHGSEAFYQGEIARAAASFVQELGGLLTEEDFGRFNVSVTTPLVFPYGEYRVATNPNIAGGGTLAILLGILEPLELDLLEPRSPERYHLLLEATRLASAGATRDFADPEFLDRAWQGMLAPAFLESRRSQILPDRRNPEIDATDPWDFQIGRPYRARGQHPHYGEEAGDGPPEAAWEEGTDHFTIVDAQGNVAVVTTTLGVGWMAGHMVPGYGFILNVTGGYFDQEPGGAHEIRPGKRPRSTMTPTIVFRHGDPVLTVGSPSPGGMQHVQVMLNILEHGMDPAHALAEPRVAPDSIWEEGVPPEALDRLREMGHPMAAEGTDRGAVVVLHRQGHAWLGAADPRRDGLAMGVAVPAAPGGR